MPQSPSAQHETRSPHGSLDISCENCHTATAWRPIRSFPEFDHNKTHFPLRGMHTSVACMQCHTKLVFTDVGNKCADCHADIHKGQFGAKCESCHTVKGWQTSLKAAREHSNRFPLMGAHAAADCESCHKSAAVGQFRGLSTDCYSCHAQSFNNAVPSHKAANFPTTCQSCHTSLDTWMSAAFDHLKFTGFALTGAHAKLDCVACHVGGRFQGQSANCVNCHLKDFNSTKSPNHASAGFPQTCQTCHSTVAWTPASFNHNATGFPLSGAHATLACSSCHLNGKFTGTPADCASCHMGDYAKATNPDHVKNSFPTTCATCHSSSAWSPATFDHNTLTKFPLTGAHANTACNSCHIGGKFAGTPTACFSCHSKDFKSTTSPNHVTAAFPTDCSVCHSTVSWSGATFNHAATGFALTGAHVSLTCATCHVSNNYSITDSSCSSCHLTAYNNTVNPAHKSAGFPLTCDSCHSTASWAGAVFNHSSTGFALTGAHVNVQCSSCHVNGKFAGTPTDCYSCHKTEFQTTTSPNHVAAAFPTTCQTCHTTASWSGATFNHTWFPIYSGSHAGKWTTCADCHTNSSDYAVFSCTNCHAHDKATTDGHHQDVRNYVYNSANCYSCHPTGGGG